MDEVARYTFMIDFYGNEVVRMEDDHIVKDEEYVLATDYDRLQQIVKDAYDALWDKKPAETEMDVIRRVVAMLYPAVKHLPHSALENS